MIAVALEKNSTTLLNLSPNPIERVVFAIANCIPGSIDLQYAGTELTPRFLADCKILFALSLAYLH